MVLYADGRGFDPHVRQHSFVEIGHEIILQSFSPFRSYQLLAKECALSTGKLPRRQDTSLPLMQKFKITVRAVLGKVNKSTRYPY